MRNMGREKRVFLRISEVPQRLKPRCIRHCGRGAEVPLFHGVPELNAALEVLLHPKAMQPRHSVFSGRLELRP